MNTRQWATLALLAIIWGSSFLFIKQGVAEMPVATVVAGRLIMGLVFLVGALVAMRLPFPRRALWGRLLVVAFLNNVVPWVMLAWGGQYIPSGVSALLNATTPLFAILLSSVWGDEKFSAWQIGGLTLGFLGVALVISDDLVGMVGAQSNSQILLAELAVLIAAAFYAVGGIYARRAFAGEPPVQLATGQLFFASLVVVPFALIPANLPTVLPSIPALLAVATLGFFGSGFAYFLFYGLLAEVGVTRTVLVTYLLPIIAMILGYAVLNEAITWQMLVGVALILGGVIFVNANGLPFRREKAVTAT